MPFSFAANALVSGCCRQYRRVLYRLLLPPPPLPLLPRTRPLYRLVARTETAAPHTHRTISSWWISGYRSSQSRRVRRISTSLDALSAVCSNCLQPLIQLESHIVRRSERQGFRCCRRQHKVYLEGSCERLFLELIQSARIRSLPLTRNFRRLRDPALPGRARS